MFHLCCFVVCAALPFVLVEASVLAAAALESSKKSKFDYTVVKTRRELEMEAVNAAITEAGVVD